jgi:sigma-B regulation protein RsbU (phosphoserine phosphatase)
LNGQSEELHNNGPALGIFSTVDYTNERKSLVPGDLLIIYTDGVVEVENQHGDPFGVARLIKVVSSNRQSLAKIILEQVIAETRAFSGSQTYLDDFTLVILKKE